jgi:hypothetical protein
MAPIESFIVRHEQEPKSWFSLKPGEERKTKKFPQAEITVKCDGLDIHGTVKVKTKAPEFIGVFLYENDSDYDPKPLETGEKYTFSGTQRIEIHSKFHSEFISLRHNVATGVIIDSHDALVAETALAHAEAIIKRKPLLVGASAQ